MNGRNEKKKGRKDGTKKDDHKDDGKDDRKNDSKNKGKNDQQDGGKKDEPDDEQEDLDVKRKIGPNNVSRDHHPAFLYTYVCHEDERELCRMELRVLFGVEPCARFLLTERAIDPSRSPFVKQRLDVLYSAGSLDELAQQAEALELGAATFKIVYVEAEPAAAYDERRRIERLLGARIRGRADMRRPQRLFGVAYAAGRWLFGECRNSEAVWLRHNAKPQPYSTALSTRVARAAANIAVPQPQGAKAIDPCCGIGTVLIEALSMGIDMIGRDLNPLAVRGARVNLRHYGYPDDPDAVAVGDIRTLQGSYDAAVVDLPYNLCSVLSQEERLDMLRGARRLARRVLVIATETIDDDLAQAGFFIIDRCDVKKGRFSRQLMVCI
ncbi:TRM11 family SAM-dependent methyltransferase [Paenibacillus piri]|uniref:RNA methyltransferase n=1 Tax=Paenibacillus piri TaxID=2547395 RepID=A0A4R5KYG0_9BACL|nr:RNA methyltransferase [Paenibacillus piri]TDG00279.1 RNA methyltransferase [Paenibacillus piri]